MDFNVERFLLILLWFSASIQLNLAEDEMEYDYLYDRIEIFNGTDEFFKYNFTVEKIESENIFIIDGTGELFQDLNDDWKFAIEVFKLENNEYESIATLPQMGVCKYMKTIYKMYLHEELSKHSNLPHFDSCTVPSGQYNITQYPYDVKIFNQYKSMISPGSYRVQGFLLQNDVAVTGVLLYFHITTKS